MTIEPGDKVRGNIAFEVPKDWERLDLVMMSGELLKPDKEVLDIEISRQ